MENVSKFLLMAATILLSVLIISMFIYIFNSGSSVSETYDRKQQVEQLELYNSKFEAYVKDNTNGEDNTILDMISLLNLAYSVNVASNYDSQDTVSITIHCSGVNISMPNNDSTLQKNEILIGNEKKEIYVLTTSTLGNLGISGIGNSEDTLSFTSLTTNNDADNPITQTYYRYFFKNTKIEYEHSNGKVSNMEFTMYENPNVDW